MSACAYMFLFLVKQPFFFIYPRWHLHCTVSGPFQNMISFQVLLLLRCEAFGTKSVNSFVRGMYSNDLFIPSAVAAGLSSNLRDFIRSHLYLAHSSYQLGLSHFLLVPKLHACHEIAHEMRRQASIASYAFNVAAHTCSLDEDFIGRCAAVSRCISPRLICQRTLERYLCGIQISWARN